jgi:hypothetical protein
MQKFGGSFVKALSQCIVVADPDNTNRIKQAFPDYWRKYSAIAANTSAERQEQ